MTRIQAPWAYLSLLFACFYLGFRLAAPWLHGLGSHPDPHTLAPWIQEYARDWDGEELRAMALWFVAYLGAAWLLVSRRDKLPMLPRWAAWGACLPAAVIVLATRSDALIPIPLAHWKIHGAFALGILVAGGLMYWIARIHGSRLILLKWPAWAVLAAILVLAGPRPYVVDYGYLLGPAGKLLQGEMPGTFYQQYGMGETLFFAAMMKLRLPLSAMQAVLGLIMALWMFAYYRLALRLLAGRTLAWLFLLTLLVTRYAAFGYCPFGHPQTSPMRLDLWVPLLLVWSRFGGYSPITACAFAGAYAFDNQFGMLLCAAYLAALLGGIVLRHPAAKRKSARLALLFLPAALVAATQVAVFGGAVSAAAAHYASLRIGFLPIASHSLFWPMALLLVFCLGILVPARRPIVLFLFPVAAVECLYFFGRSVDGALLSISGVFVLALFLALDRTAMENPGVDRRAVARPAGDGPEARPAGEISGSRLGWAVLIVSGLLFGEGIYARVSQLHRNLTGALWTRTPEELQADRDPDPAARFPGRRLLLVNPTDAYFYYRWRLPVPGFWTPFAAHYDVDGTALYLRDRLLAGDVVLSWGWEGGDAFLAPVENSPALRQSGYRLLRGRSGPYATYELEKIPALQ